MPLKATSNAILVLVALSLLAPCASVHAQNSSSLAQSPADELARLHGSWQGVESGRESEGQCKLTIDGNAVRFERANKREWYAGTITLPAGKNPKQMHAAITECSHPEAVGKTAIAIYKLDGGTLTLVGHAPGVTEAPRTFEGDETTRTFVLKQAVPQVEKSARMSTPDLKPGFAKDSASTVEERFQEADIALAIAHYEKLQTAAFELRLKRELEPQSDPGQSEEWAKKEARLRDEAAMLKAEAIKRGTASRR